ncbi:hypothetical protein SPLC1_S060550 [Arthrospira platensis C1]|nr:hypothetical protein SPLC1_S060550 [Arthrospira platensis C1]
MLTHSLSLVVGAVFNHAVVFYAIALSLRSLVCPQFTPLV